MTASLALDPSSTIVAISSAGGHGGRGIIRLSGAMSFMGVEKIFRSDDSGGEGESEFRQVAGRCYLNDDISVAATIYKFGQGHSYTTEDMIELHLPGSPALLGMVLEKLLSLDDIRMAQPGEFTARAFFNGRIDLTEAEAVAEVIHAQSDTQLRAAERLLDGQLHRFCSEVSERLSMILAEIEADIDFSEGDDADLVVATDDKISGELGWVLNAVDELLANSRSWDDIHHLPVVVLAGPANAGKSSLANRLLGMDRSIVSQIAGTTRDLLSAPLQLADGECLLIDTAGLGDVVDPLAEATQLMTQKGIEGCDLLIWVEDISADGEVKGLPNDMKLPANVLMVGNKCDLREDKKAEERSELFVSAATGENIEALLEAINRILHNEMAVSMGADAMALTSRQKQALADSRLSVIAGLKTVSQGYPQQAEILALEIRETLDSIGVISGQVVNDDIFSKIFENFCIGK